MAIERKQKNLFCLDDYDAVEVFGEGDFTDYQRLDILYLACTSVTNPNCNHTLNETETYLGEVQLTLLMNNKVFNEN